MLEFAIYATLLPLSLHSVTRILVYDISDFKKNAAFSLINVIKQIYS